MKTPRKNGAKVMKAGKLASAAIGLAKRGYALVPMYSAATNGECSCFKGGNCTSPGKHPSTDFGVKDASASKSVVRRWWRSAPKANIGIAVGASKLLVLDVDPRSDGTATLEALVDKLGPLNANVSADTGGGGGHYYFLAPSFAIKKDNAGKVLGQGIDILTGHSIAIAPPSVHSSGGVYRWHEGKSLLEAVPGKLPKAWRDFIRKQQKSTMAEFNSADATEIKKGSRNTTLTSIAGKLRNTGIGEASIMTVLQQENKRCRPPLSDAELKKIAKSIAGKSVLVAKGAADGDVAARAMQLTLDEHFSGGKHLMSCDDGQFWQYVGTHWKPIADASVKSRCLKVIQRMPNRGPTSVSGILGQVMQLIKPAQNKEGDVLRFLSEPLPVINCANGELWFSEDGKVKLRAHQARSFLRYCLDVKYDPKAKSPRYDKAIKEIFSQAKPSAKGMSRHWNEFLGYIIQSGRDIAVIGVFRGGGDNGKTTLMRTAMNLMGPDMVSAQSIESLEHRFAMGSLLGKHLLLDDDVKDGIRLPDGLLKKISEAKVVTGEHKHGKQFNFVVRAVPVLLCNNVPSLADVSLGMRRRLMVIPFDRTFSAHEKDDELFRHIWREEMPGVLNRAIAGFQRLQARKMKFRMPNAVAAATQAWLKEANPLPAFLEERCERDPNAKCLLANFYKAYTDWSLEKGYTRVKQSTTLSRSIQHLGYTVTKRSRGQTILGLRLRKK